MRYIQPQITGTYPALSAIRSVKGPSQNEMITGNFTSGPAYQADE